MPEGELFIVIGPNGSGKTTLLEIDRNTLERLFETNYHLAYIFMRNIAMLTGKRLNQVQNKLARVLADEAATGW